jgi:hypothetical protein
VRREHWHEDCWRSQRHCTGIPLAGIGFSLYLFLLPVCKHRCRINLACLKTDPQHVLLLLPCRTEYTFYDRFRPRLGAEFTVVFLTTNIVTYGGLFRQLWWPIARSCHSVVGRTLVTSRTLLTSNIDIYDGPFRPLWRPMARTCENVVEHYQLQDFLANTI